MSRYFAASFPFDLKECACWQDFEKERLEDQETDETIHVSREEFAALVRTCQKQWREAWSKEYREMDPDRLGAAVKGYMKDWMMIRENEEEVVICPAAGKQLGFYPKDYMEKTGE